MRLAIGVRVPPAFLGLLRVLGRIAVAEDLQHLVRIQVDAHLPCLQCSSQRLPLPVQFVPTGVQQGQLPPQMPDRIVVIDDQGDVGQSEAARAVGEDPSQSVGVRR